MTWLVPTLLALTAPAHAGLFGGSAPGRIPVPARVFAADVEDLGGVVVHVTRVTFDGEIYLFGRLGRAQVTVPFEQITEATFEPGPDEDHRLAIVRLTDGSEVRIELEADRPFYGLGHFGNYRLDALDTRRITIRSDR